MLRLHRGRLALDARGEPSANVRSDTLPDEIALAPLLPPELSAGQALTLALPGWSGGLHLEPVAQGGLAWVDLAALVARPRRGGEQFQSHAAGVPRALKKQFQAAGVPAWLRDAPLLWRGERLVCVPALGVDAREQAPPGAPQWRPRWAG
jgi:tRNA(Ile)-lysidine synthase